MKCLGIRNARYASADLAAIDLDLETDEGTLPYTYIPGDSAPAAQWIAANLDYLNVADYTPPQAPVVSLEEAKRIQERELESAWASAMKEGLATSVGITVKSEATDLTMFQLGLKKAQASGVLPLLRDYEGTLHRDVPAPTVATIVLELEDHLDALWTRKVLLQEQVRSAETTADVEAITWETPL